MWGREGQTDGQRAEWKSSTMELLKGDRLPKVIPKEGLRNELLADGGDYIEVVN